MKRKKTAGRNVSGMTKILAVVVIMAMVLMMSKNAFANGIFGDVDGAGNSATLVWNTVSADGSTVAAQSYYWCTVTVTAFYYNAGNTTTNTAIGGAYTTSVAPNNTCTSATSTHRVYLGNNTYFVRSLP